MAVKTRAELHAENAADFPDNTTRQISAADLRGQMDDLVDSAVFPEDGVGGNDEVSIGSTDPGSEFELWVDTTGTALSLTEAPADGRLYGRRNAAWTEVQAGNGTLEYTWSSATTEPPGFGEVRANNASWASVTRLWINDFTRLTTDASSLLTMRLRDGARVYVQDKFDATRWVEFGLLADAANDGTHYDCSVEYVGSGEPLTPGAPVFMTMMAGPTGGQSAVDVQTFAVSGTWTKPLGAKLVRVQMWGGGGGGGGGARVTAGTTASGGGGGGGGAYQDFTFVAANLGATETVTVGPGTAGGAGATVDGNPGANGGPAISAPNATLFGPPATPHLRAMGGGAGTGGTPAAVAGSGGGGSFGGGSGTGADASGATAGAVNAGAGRWQAGAGAVAANFSTTGMGGANGLVGAIGGQAPNAPGWQCSGGSGGGGISAGAAFAGAPAAATMGMNATAGSTIAGGANTGGNGADGNTSASGFGHCGGGGGGNFAGAGGNAGASGRGAGGSGGGSAVGGNGGAGAAGGNGYVIVISWK
jgi:hypothetical protein